MTLDEMGVVVVRIDERTKNTYDLVKDHETRIRSGEKFRWLMMGGIILVTTVGGWGLFG